MLKIDKMTYIQSRGKFARICVELDVSKPLIPHIVIRGHKLLIEYEGLHLVCFQCGRYGHRAEQCTTQGPMNDSTVVQSDVIQGQNQGPQLMWRLLHRMELFMS